MYATCSQGETNSFKPLHSEVPTSELRPYRSGSATMTRYEDWLSGLGVTLWTVQMEFVAISDGLC
jgi:hypothetical protein